jgi:hypothetical protein
VSSKRSTHDEHSRDSELIATALAEIPAEQIERIPTLPRGWRTDVRKTQAVGDAWLERSSSVALEVPSVLYRCGDVVPKNYLINPLHAKISEINIGRFRALDIDPRIG